MTDTHLAQLNVARPRASMDDLQMADFKAALEPINRLAEAAQGFVWRLTDGFGGDATTIRIAGGELMVNLSVWESRDALWNFAYDAGYGAGPALFGLICVRTGYPAAFALTGALILAAVPAALRAEGSGQRRTASVTTP